MVLSAKQSTLALGFLIAILFNTVCGSSRAVCVDHTAAYGFINSTTSEHRYIEKGRLEGDMERIGNTPVWEVAFARPSEVMVCADEDYVHGIQLTMREHEANDLEGIDPDSDYTRQKIAEIDATMNTILTSIKPTKMNLIGTQTAPCETLQIAGNDRIVSVDLESDTQNLRRISFNLASKRTAMYGGPAGKQGEDLGFKTMTFKFFDDKMIKHDIIGIYGYVAPDPATNGRSDHIVSLGFLENTCPARGPLDFESEYAENAIAMEAALSSVTDSTLAVAILCTLIGGVTIGAIYCYLKNRGTICNKGGVRELDRAVKIEISGSKEQVPSDDITVTNVRVPSAADVTNTSVVQTSNNISQIDDKL